jgi:hypothetical protein
VVQRCRACGREVTVAPWEGGFFVPIIIFGTTPFGFVGFLTMRFGWWLGLLAGLALLPILLAGVLSVLAWWLAKAAVYLGAGLRTCPACGARRWGWPQTGPVPLP